LDNANAELNGMMLFTLVLLPLAVGFVLLFLPRRVKFVPGALALIVSSVSFLLAVRVFTLGLCLHTWTLFELSISNIKLDLSLCFTSLGSFILIFACGFGLLITLYSLKTRVSAARPGQYYGAILLTIGGSAGILLCDHLLFLLIFWEIVTVSLYILITTGGRGTNFAATKSFAMIGATDGAFLLGAGLVWVLSGTFVISRISLPTDSVLSVIAFLLLMTAAVTKAGALPLHTWLPTTGEFAPASIMALLPAAIDKLLGIYLLVIVVRNIFIINSPALSVILAIIGAVTIVIAVMIAMVQHNLKKLLSYHAVSQVGYMILGISTGTPVGIAGGIFHMLNNAVYKSCLFLCGGSVEQATGTAELDRLGGLGKKMSITFVACLIAALSISGIPPFNGFVSKWMVYQGVIQMGKAGASLWPIWLLAAMFGSALTLASFVKVLHSVFLSRLPEGLKDVKEVSPPMWIPCVVLAFLCVLFGVFYRVPLNLFIYPGLGIEPGTAIFSTWESGLATVLIVVGIVLGLVILGIGGLVKKARVVPTWNCGEKRQSEEMIIPGTHFYKTVSELGGLKQLYTGQEKRWFDLYDQLGRVGLALTRFLRMLHSGILSSYMTWVTLGLVIVLFIICRIW
jgi:formate hydrogenlyase subunit 3/multisubunit Na+/H+ antiporter MnhD subunit